MAKKSEREHKKRCHPGEGTECSLHALSCLGGAPFYGEESVNWMHKGAPYGVGVHVEETGDDVKGWLFLVGRNARENVTCRGQERERDRKRGRESTRKVRCRLSIITFSWL